MKNQGNFSPPKSHNNSIIESKDNKLVQMCDREFRHLLLNMINNLKEYSNKKINDVRKSIQDLDKKVSNMEEKFSKEMKIIKKVEC
jgi:esterase/lipase